MQRHLLPPWSTLQPGSSARKFLPHPAPAPCGSLTLFARPTAVLRFRRLRPPPAPHRRPPWRQVPPSPMLTKSGLPRSSPPRASTSASIYRLPHQRPSLLGVFNLNLFFTRPQLFGGYAHSHARLQHNSHYVGPSASSPSAKMGPQFPHFVTRAAIRLRHGGLLVRPADRCRKNKRLEV